MAKFASMFSLRPLPLIISLWVGVLYAAFAPWYQGAAMGLLGLATIGMIWQGKDSPWRYGVGLGVVACLLCSGVFGGSPGWIGMVGAFAIHIPLLGFYGIFLFQMVRRTITQGRVDEAFMRLDLWLVNLGLVACTAVVVTRILGHGRDLQGVMGALRSGLLPLTIIVAFLLSSRAGESVASARLLWVGMLSAVLALGGVTIWRFIDIGRHLDQGRGFIALGFPDEAARLAQRAEKRNATLRWKGFESRIMALQNPEGDASATDFATEAAIDRIGEGLSPPARRMLEEYLRFDPLGDLLRTLNSSEQRRHWNAMHRALSRDPAALEQILRGFVEKGLLDRLSERYAWSGFPQIDDAAAFELALRRYLREYDRIGGEVEYFLGLLHDHTGNRNAARLAFRRSLARSPAHANALAWLDRLGDSQNTRQRGLRRIEYRQAFGPGREMFSVADALWMAVEVESGPVRLAFDMRGWPLEGVWPEMALYLDDAAEPVFRGTVGSSEWSETVVDLFFRASGRRRLLLVLENMESAETGQGRRLEFRSVRVEFPS